MYCLFCCFFSNTIALWCWIYPPLLDGWEAFRLAGFLEMILLSDAPFLDALASFCFVAIMFEYSLPFFSGSVLE